MRGFGRFFIAATALFYVGCTASHPPNAQSSGGSPLAPTTTDTLALGENLAATTGQVISNVTITTTSGPCLVVQGVTDVWIDRVTVGPCGAQGIYVIGAARVRITNSVIHTDHGDTSGFGTGTAVLIQNSTDVLVQGNQISNSASSVLAQASPKTKIIGNYSQNPLGPFPNASHFQLTTGSSQSSITDNFGEQVPRFRGAPYDGQFIEDGINIYQTGNVLIARNFIRDGDSANGCGIVIGDSFDGLPGDGVTVTDNTLIRTSHCGIGVVGGSNHILRGNKILDPNFVGDSGSSGIQVWDWRGLGTCANISVRSNIVSNLMPGGWYNDYWNGSGRPTNFRCRNVDVIQNVSGANARNLLTPEASKLPTPAIPPLRY